MMNRSGQVRSYVVRAIIIAAFLAAFIALAILFRENLTQSAGGIRKLLGGV